MDDHPICAANQAVRLLERYVLKQDGVQVGNKLILTSKAVYAMLESANFLAATLFAMHFYRQNEIEELINPKLNLGDSQMSLVEGLAYAFHMDVAGIADSMATIGWYNANFSEQSSKAFVDTFGERPTAILIANTPRTSLVLPFVFDSNTYKIDFGVLTIFSMFVNMSALYDIGVKAREMNRHLAFLHFACAWITFRAAEIFG